MRNESQKCEQFLDVLLSVRDTQRLRLLLTTFGGSHLTEEGGNFSMEL
jgi:hypothetical protein